jgi:alkaline phosphatase
MNACRYGLLSLALLFVASGPAVAQESAPEKGKKSVILFIGDGMGTSQVTLGRLGARELGQPYNLDRLPVVGLASTRSANNRVTDSAASATALACGVKTNNQMIAQDPAGTPLQTILEVAHASSYGTGLVTTTRITHATPGSFAAHVKHRYNEGGIAEQLSTKGYPEVLIGGGAKKFKAEHLDAFRANGYEVVLEPSGLAGAKGDKLAAFVSKSHVPYKADGGARVTLSDMTQKAVGMLAKKGPFFLMVEGGRIDHACHGHDAVGAMHEQLEFDAAVGWALDRAKKDPNLLIVVTADHATGAMGISELVQVQKILDGGASTEELAKIRKPEALAAAVKKAYGFELSAEEMARVFEQPKNKYWARTTLGHFVSQHLGVYFYDLDDQQTKMTNTHGHDGADVPVFAFGPGAEAFAGSYENTEIPKTIVAILGLEKGVEKGGALAQAGPQVKKARKWAKKKAKKQRKKRRAKTTTREPDYFK